MINPDRIHANLEKIGFSKVKTYRPGIDFKPQLVTKKENLILVHSFPTNSILLKGFIGYIDDYFNVYPIDLPGFRKDIKPLQKITIDSYSKFVEEKVKKLNLDDFLIGGISFGFIVVNNAKIDKKCKGIIAIEPYVNSKSLRMSWPNNPYPG